MKNLKTTTSILAVILLAIGLAGCSSNQTTPDNSTATEVSNSYDEFPQVTVKAGNNFNFDYYVTSTKISETITDSILQKELKPKGKYLIVEFSATNKGKTEEFGNKPVMQLEYNDQVVEADVAASAAEEENVGLKSYTTEKVKTDRKGKYVKVFDLENYDSNVKTAKFNIMLPEEKASGSIEITVPTILGMESNTESAQTPESATTVEVTE